MVQTQRDNNCATTAITAGRPAGRAVNPVFHARADSGRGVTQFLGVGDGRNARARVLCPPPPTHRSGHAPRSCRPRDERTADDDGRRDENKNKQ